VTPLLEVGCTPAQPSSSAPPVAKQLAALAEVQLSVVVLPVVIVKGVAVRPLIVAGAAPTLTVTVAELGALVPPVPEQVSVYVTGPFARSGVIVVPVLEVAFRGNAQRSPTVPPLPVHVVAFVVVQAIEIDCPS
jgi:hypothetical protein